MSLIAIAALSPRRVIGNGGSIPWHYPQDLAKFKELTSGGVVIMGRKTYESIGKRLPNRVNIVVTTKLNGVIPLLFTVSSVEQTLGLIKKLNLKKNFIIGGERIYRDFLPHCDELYLTHVPDDVSGDVFFPEYKDSFISVETEDLEDGLIFERLKNASKNTLGQGSQ